MKLERIQTIQRLPISVEGAWDFFTTPQNLSLITPPWLDFRLSVSPPEYLHPGTIYGAQIRPFPGISMQIVTEFSHIRAPSLFITQQRVGPFKIWHHEHHFKEHKDGVEIEDIVLYGVPFGIVGTFLHDLVIRKRLHEIFTYRARALEQRFGAMNRPKPAPPKIPVSAPTTKAAPNKGALKQTYPPKKQAPKPAPSNAPSEQRTITLDDIFGGTPDD